MLEARSSAVRKLLQRRIGWAKRDPGFSRPPANYAESDDPFGRVCFRRLNPPDTFVLKLDVESPIERVARNLQGNAENSETRTKTMRNVADGRHSASKSKEARV
jgi:hypothetical protein